MITETIITDLPTVPVTLALAKAHLNIEADFVLDDVLIGVYIAGAVAEAKGSAGHALYQTRVWSLDNFDQVCHGAAFADAVIDKIEVMDSEGAYSDLPEANYWARKVDNYRMELNFIGDDLPELPENDAAVKVTITTTCPDDVISGILLRIGDMYLRREDRSTGDASTAVQNLWRPYRKWD